MRDKPYMPFAVQYTRNAHEAVRRYDLFDKFLHPDAMDKAELELLDAWWVTPEQRKMMGDHKKPS